MADTPHIVYVPWTDWARGQKFLIDQHTQLRVERAALPIIFVPGIMGSRLMQKGGKRAWDPDDLLWMKRTVFNASPTQREDLLTKNPLEVNKNEAGGKPTMAFRDRMRMKYSVSTQYSVTAVPPNWDWLALPPSLTGSAKLEKMLDLLIDHGWDQVAWGFYGDILLQLAVLDFGDLSRCFVHPVYAFGYNWIDDNLLAGEALAARIDEIIEKENYAHHPCDRVILVSHSMGGLVTRSCVLHSDAAKAKTLGIVHGAQPATGAPAAYRRMRAGFEPPNNYHPLDNLVSALTNRMLGPDSATVVPVLAKCIGGLELLPTKLYKTNAGSAQWLTLTGKDGKVACSMPTGNPYQDIYALNAASGSSSRTADQQFLTLIPHTPLLTPGASTVGTSTTRYGPGAESLRASKDFQTNLTAAETFHDALQLKAHPTTFVTFTGHGGPKTYDHVRYAYLREQNETRYGSIPNGYGIPMTYTYPAPPEHEGQGIDLNQHPSGSKTPEYFELQGQDGGGDGTVPVSSAKSLLNANGDVQTANSKVCDPAGKRISADIAKVDHSGFFSNADAINFTLMAIRQLDYRYRKLKIGF